ncbi:glycosyltransferase [Streptococcus parasanguinis]|uniref:glycosyltransferase n=1 Tax=Streptococcus parasanguinis TaxID=1318 RepID=UPI00319DD90B
MTIYTFNLLVGYEPNGVDVAQASRAKILRGLGVTAKFVFTAWPTPEKLAYYLSLGHRDEELLFAHLTFTDQKTSVPQKTVGDLQMEFQLTRLDTIEKTEGAIRYQFADKNELTFHLDPYHPDCVRYVDYLLAGNMIKREYYGACKLATEYFQYGRILRRTYHNQDGSIAFEELRLGESWLYKLGPEVLTNHTEVMRRFLLQLSLKEEDLILLDRASRMDFARPLLEKDAPSKLAMVFHSEHEFENGHLNYEYYYVFKYAKRFDYFITATDLQKEVLEQTLAKQGCKGIPIYSIPVGHLETLTEPQGDRQPYSVITASRLDPRKRIDLVIRVVAQAKKRLPALQFDIYGKGGEADRLQHLIQELAAQDYIHLRGHADLQQIYPCYQVYLTTSQWETFGLTLMEAAGAGLALLGFDARYGNPTFIKEGENGYLVPYSEIMPEEQLVKELAEKLVQLFESDLAPFHQASYDLASCYLTSKVLEVWRETLMEMGQLGGKEI